MRTALTLFIHGENVVRALDGGLGQREVSRQWQGDPGARIDRPIERRRILTGPDIIENQVGAEITCAADMDTGQIPGLTESATEVFDRDGLQIAQFDARNG